jgi:hypothetical protein
MEVLLDCPEIDMGLDAHQAKKLGPYSTSVLSTTGTASGHKTFAKLFTCELAMPAACKSLFLCSQKINWKYLLEMIAAY